MVGDQTRVLAARYLGELGDDSALSPLRRLAAQGDGDPTVNPYLEAVEAIAGRVPSVVPDPNTVPRAVATPDEEVSETVASRPEASPSGCRGSVVDRQGRPIAGAKVVLFYDGIVHGLTYHVRDARFDSMQEFSREEKESWVDTDRVLLPLESDTPHYGPED